MLTSSKTDVEIWNQFAEERLTLFQQHSLLRDCYDDDGLYKSCEWSIINMNYWMVCRIFAQDKYLVIKYIKVLKKWIATSWFFQRSAYFWKYSCQFLKILKSLMKPYESIVSILSKVRKPSMAKTWLSQKPVMAEIKLYWDLLGQPMEETRLGTPLLATLEAPEIENRLSFHFGLLIYSLV